MSIANAGADNRAERTKQLEHLKKSAPVGFFAILKQALFQVPEPAEQTTKRQLSTARSIAGENASAETVATIAQTLATDEQTTIIQAQKR